MAELLNILSLLVSGGATGISVYSFLVSRHYSKSQTALAMHSRLFESAEDFEILYVPARYSECYFDQDHRNGEDENNFLGSTREKKFDLFLERLNFVCLWLLSFRRSGEQDELFQEYIRDIYTAPFFQRYFSFLDVVDPERYFQHIHKYASERLRLPRPRVRYATSPEELAEMQLLTFPGG